MAASRLSHRHQRLSQHLGLIYLYPAGSLDASDYVHTILSARLPCTSPTSHEIPFDWRPQ